MYHETDVHFGYSRIAALAGAGFGEGGGGAAAYACCAGRLPVPRAKESAAGWL
ncbi:hypothetical protein D3C78_1656660 [compost metagenome]